VSKRPLTHILVLSAALLIGAGPYVVRAAGTAADPGTVANVDMQRLYDESTARRTAIARVQERARVFSDNFEATMRLQYLSLDEYEQFTIALNADPQTEADKKQVTDLKAESSKRTDEAQKLATTPQDKLTAQDKDRLRVLNGYQQQRQQAMTGLQGAYRIKLDEEDARQNRLGMAEVRSVVTKLAKDQSITQVYDSTAMVVAPVDLTQQALQKVKTKK
jgi:hypothetical protein